MNMHVVEWNWDGECCADDWYSCFEHGICGIFSTERKAAEFVQFRLEEELKLKKSVYEEEKDAPWNKGVSLNEYLENHCGFVSAPTVEDILKEGADNYRFTGEQRGGSEWYEIDTFEMD